MISFVKDLKKGQIWFYEGVLCEITSFPTRSMVCLENVDHGLHLPPEWKSSKTSIKDLKGKGRFYRGLRRFPIIDNPCHKNEWIDKIG